MATNDDARTIIGRYLDRMPKASEVYLHDPTYHAQITFMERVLTAVDMAMEDEDVPRETRLRVLRSVTLGAPDEAEAMARIERLAERVSNAHLAEICPYRNT